MYASLIKLVTKGALNNPIVNKSHSCRLFENQLEEKGLPMVASCCLHFCLLCCCRWSSLN